MARTALACAVALLLAAAPAAAGPPGSWTKLAPGDSTTKEIGVARGPDGKLNVLWTTDKTVQNTQLSADAKTVAGPFPVFTYGDGVSGGVSLLPAAGGLRAFFAGLYHDHPLDVGLATATSATGTAWSVQQTLASDSRTGMRSSVYAAQGIGGTVAPNGTPVSIWGDSAPGQAGYHVGVSDQTADVHFGGNSATVASPNAASDSASGRVAIGWNDIDAGYVIVQSISPPAARVQLPGAQAPDLTERLSMTGRIGAPGIYVAYLRGENVFTSPPAVWRFGASSSTVLRAGARARFVGVAAAPGGRLWAFWAERPAGTEWRIYARRSNAAATAWGAIVTIKPPKAAGGPFSGSVYSLEGEGTAPGGALDLLALFQRSDDDVSNWHQRIRPGLTLLAKALGDGRVAFTVRDAGDPVAATVRFAGKSAGTGADGKVTMSAAPGRRTARAQRSGYAPAKRRVKVSG